MTLPFPTRHSGLRTLALAALLCGLVFVLVKLRSAPSLGEVGAFRLFAPRRETFVELHRGDRVSYAIEDSTREVRLFVLHADEGGTTRDVPTMGVALRSSEGRILDRRELTPRPAVKEISFIAAPALHGHTELTRASYVRLALPEGHGRLLTLDLASSSTTSCALVRIVAVKHRSSDALALALHRRGDDERARLAKLDALDGRLIGPGALRRALRTNLVRVAPEGDPGRDFRLVELSRGEVPVPEEGALREAVVTIAPALSRERVLVAAFVPSPDAPIRILPTGPLQIRARALGDDGVAPAPEIVLTSLDANRRVLARSVATVCAPVESMARVQGDDRALGYPVNYWTFPSREASTLFVTGSPSLCLTFQTPVEDATLVAGMAGDEPPPHGLRSVAPLDVVSLRLAGRVATLDLPSTKGAEPAAPPPRLRVDAEMPVEPPIPEGLPRRVHVVEQDDTAQRGSETTYVLLREGVAKLDDPRPLADPRSGAELAYGMRSRSGSVGVVADGHVIAILDVPAGSGRLSIPGRSGAASELRLEGIGPGERWLLNRRSPVAPLWIRRDAYELAAGARLVFQVMRSQTGPTRLELRILPLLSSTGKITLAPLDVRQPENVLCRLPTRRLKIVPIEVKPTTEMFSIPPLGEHGAPMALGLTLGDDLLPGRYRVAVSFEGKGTVLVRSLGKRVAP